MKKIDIKEETLRILYLKEGKTYSEIGRILGVSYRTVFKYMKEYGIESRDHNVDTSLLTKIGMTNEEFEKVLYQKYVVDEISQIKIAKEFNVSLAIIKKYLDRYNIPTRNHKDSNKVSNSGEKNHKWNGGIYCLTSGYTRIYVTVHPSLNAPGYIYEHRNVVEEHLGRYLEKDEHVHHLNGIKSDNRLENLQVMSNSEHQKIHAKTHVPAMNKARLKKFNK